jgi:hypothetical protein
LKQEFKKILIEGDEKPPLFKTWKGWYSLVLGFLSFLIILFYIFTRIFE